MKALSIVAKSIAAYALKVSLGFAAYYLTGSTAFGLAVGFLVGVCIIGCWLFKDFPELDYHSL